MLISHHISSRSKQYIIFKLYKIRCPSTKKSPIKNQSCWHKYNQALASIQRNIKNIKRFITFINTYIVYDSKGR